MGKLNYYMHRVPWAVTVIGAACFPIMMALTVWEALARYVFGASFEWLLEISVGFMIVAAYMGLGFTHKEKAHVRIDLVTSHFPVPVQRVLETVVSFINLTFAVLLLWGSVKVALYFWTMKMVSESEYTTYWVLEIPILIGVLIFILEILVITRKLIRRR